MKNKKAALVLFAAAAVLVCGCLIQGRMQAKNRTAEKQLFAMDTLMSFTASGQNSEEAVSAAMKEIQRLDALWSIGKPESEVSRLNSENGGEVSEDTERLLAEAISIYNDTGGLFDFTVYPLMELWGFPTGEYRVPSKDEISALLPYVDGSKVKLQNGKATFGKGQKIDLGGIAKGYSGAITIDIFRSYGVTSGMVSLGGNIQALGARPDGKPWRIGIQDPEGAQGAYLGVLEVTDKAVVTSGGYERYFEENGHTYIHIIDPRTGAPAESDLLSATVVSGNGTLADGLSTALFIMGKDRAEEFWKAHPDKFDMILVTKGGEVRFTEGIQNSFETERKTAVVKNSRIKKQS